MNFKQKIEERKRIKDLFINNYPSGCIKITKGESELHARVKLQVVHYLLNQGYECYTECNFKSGLRADIVAIAPLGMIGAFCFEILCSEKEKDLLNKNYPLEIIPVDAKTFDYGRFKI